MELKNQDLNEKWLKYNQIRLKGDKKSANKLLNDFIKSILQYDDLIIEDFVYQVCSEVLKDEIISNNGSEVSNAPVRIQHPLLKNVILPILIKKYKENNPLYIRWIAQFEQFFYSDNKITNYFLEEINDELKDAVQFSKEKNQYINVKCRYFSAKQFLMKSLKIENNQITIDLILYIISQGIDYQTHELPLLIGTLDDLIENINEFKYYYEKFNNKNKWTQKLKSWNDILEKL